MKSVPANAILNLKEEPATLYVHGSVMTFNHNSTLTFHASLGSDDPNTLILEVQVSSGTHPTAAHPQSYLYASSAPEVRSYKRVLITPPNLEPVTVDVQVFR